MLDTNENSLNQPLGDGLVMRTAVNADDVERVSRFNGVIHGQGVVGMTRNIFLHHPDTRGRDLIFVEEGGSGDVVSSLCLIPWTVSYDGVTFTSGEMGIVGTLEPYRRRGLIRDQVRFYKQRLRERGCLLSHIQGIPYYYRQFGYEYAMPLDGGLRLTRRDVPQADGAAAFTFRLASVDDLPALMQMADEAGRELNIHSVRGEPVWRYLLAHSEGTEMESEVWIVQQGERPVGYIRLPRHHFGEELTVSEVSRMSFDAALAALRHAADLAEARHTPGVRLCLPASGTLMRAARSFGAHDMGTYAWQVHIPDPAALLRAIAPALERRVAASPFAGLSREVSLCFFRQTISLQFEAGTVTAVRDLGAGAGGVANMPPQAFIPLVLGYRSIDELYAVYADLHVSAAHRLLVETLFPRLTSFLYTIY